MLVAVNLAAQSPLSVTRGSVHEYQIDAKPTISNYHWEVYTDENLISQASPADVTLTTLGAGRENEIQVTWNETGTYYLAIFATGTDGCTNKMAYPFIVEPSTVDNIVVADPDFYEIYGEETILNVLGNDYDPDEGEVDPSSLTIVTDPDFNGPYHGNVFVNDNGTILYTPDPGYSGLDSFVYRVCDDFVERACDTAIVRLEVYSSDRLVANNDHYWLYTGQTGHFNIAANDYDPQDQLDLSSIVIIADPENGNVIANGDGTVTYQPLPRFEGVDSFQYVICDSSIPQECDSAWVYINIHTNECVSAVWDDAQTYVQQEVTIPVLNNDYDYEDELDSASLTIVYKPTHGNIQINEDLTITYLPDDLFAGVDSFIYQICDKGYPEACCDTAVVYIQVIDTNIGIIANRDDAITLENEPVNIPILNNDFDEDGTIDSTSITIVTDPTNGEVSINDDGTITYTPDTNFNGTDSVIYRVCDNGPIVSCDTAIVYIIVTKNLPPVAVDDNVIAWVGNDTTFVVSLNDYDPEGALDSNSVTIVDPPLYGSLVVDPITGIINYSPDSCAIVIDSFTYVIYDDYGNVSNEATVYINLIFDPSMDSDFDGVPDLVEDINGNGSPCDDDTDGDGTPDYLDIDDDGDGVLTINEDINRDGDPINDDTDGDGTPNYLDTDDDDDCTLTIVEVDFNNGNYLFDLDNDGVPNYLDNDDDGDGVTSCDETQDLDGNGILDRDEIWNSTAIDDALTSDIGAPVVIPVLANDSSQMKAPTIRIIVDPNHGYVVVNDGDWTITYYPDVDFVGIDSFLYEVCDYYNRCDSAWVYISIEDLVSPPQLFTPNDDGENDYYVIKGLERYSNNNFVVYNRWGNKVYEKQDYENNWDGYANVRTVMGDRKLPIGVYYYILTYGERPPKAGALFLER